jgi:hopanoid biosynthesis associated RND transporter like protein HpnN
VEAEGLDARIGSVCGRWMAFVDRHAGPVLLATGLLTVLAALYAALNLGINAEPKTLINPSLRFQTRQKEIAGTFHTLNDGILVVIDAESPFAAGRAAESLAAKLAERKDLFSEVAVPGGGPFFAKNALLYLDVEQLENLVDRLSTVQPFLAAFSRDQSLVTVSDLLRDALAAARSGQRLGLDLPLVLDRVSTAAEATVDGRPAPDPWGSALMGDALPPEARQRVVALRPVLDYSSLLNAAPAVTAIRETAAALELDAAHGLRVRVTGDPVLNYEELIAIGRQSRVTAVASFVLFSLTVIYALRSTRIIVALLGSLLVSLAWTNAVAAATVHQLNQISAVFNVFIVGLGGEFGIHFCMGYQELCASGRSRTEALVLTGQSIGGSLVSSTATTSIGFFVFLLTDFVGVAQLGLVTGIGMVVSLLSTLTVAPAILAVGAPTVTKVEAAQPPWAKRLEHLPLAYARPIRWGAVAAALLALILVPRAHFDHNPLELRDPNTESVQTFEDLLANRSTSPWTIDVVAPKLETAEILAKRLAQLPVVSEARTLDDWVPKDQEEKREVLETASFFVPPLVSDVPNPPPAAQRAALERLAAAAAESAKSPDARLAASATRLHTALRRFLDGQRGDDDYRKLQMAIVGSLPAQVRDLRPMLTPGPVTRDDLPPDLTEQYLAPDGRARIELVPREDVSDSRTLERFVDTVRTIVPDAGGMAVWLVEWGRVAWNSMRAALVGGMLAMLIFLLIMWRSVRDTLLAFFPLLLAAGLTWAMLVVLGRPFNFANVIVLPMLIGMGVDNGVHLVHRHRTHEEEVDVLGTSTARAVFYAAVTTVMAFGSLGFASHKGMAATGQLLTIGVALTLLCYVVVLPAVLEWDDRHRRRP